MEQDNIKRLEHVAEGLDDLNERVTYVGGSVAGLYPQTAAAPSRPTVDVDCVVEYFSFSEKEEFVPSKKDDDPGDIWKHIFEEKEDEDYVGDFIDEEDLVNSDDKPESTGTGDNLSDYEALLNHLKDLFDLSDYNDEDEENNSEEDDD
jgi:hypothetical protein